MDRFTQFVEPAAATFRLPTSRTPIIGRQDDLARTSQLIDDGQRLVTLVGAGGVGKTRLALAVAEAQRSRFQGRVGWVSLGELTDPDLLLDAIARSLDIGTSGRTVLDALVAALGTEPALIVVDNMEQLTNASGNLADLLDRAPELSLLVTSRAPLRLIGEREVRIQPFPPVDGSASPDALEAHPAIQLFLARARAVEASFEPDAVALAQIADIVGALDFLPLAIELAAARVRHFSLGEIRSLLSSQLDLLTGGPRDAPDRHRTIRATIGWSYELLQPEEQQLFRTLSVFPGSFTLESVVELTERAGITRLETIDGVSTLVDQNLLMRLTDPAAGRYAMLGSMRDFGQAQLIGENEDHAVRARFAETVLERIQPSKLPSQDDVAWLERVESSMDDVRAAFAWLLANGEGARAVKLTNDLGGWWSSRGNPREGHRFYAAALATQPDLTDSQRFDAVRDYVWLLALTGDLSRAVMLREEIEPLARKLGDPVSLIKAEQLLGALAFIEGRFEEGRERTQQAIELAEASGVTRRFQGLIYNIATLAEIDGDYDQALAYHRRGLELIEPGEHRGLYAMHQLGIASLALRGGNPLEADRLVREVWAEIAQVRNQQVITGALVVKAEVFLEFGDPIRAARLLGAADKLIEIFGRVLVEVELAELAALKERIARGVPADVLALESALGYAMSLEELGAEIALPMQPVAAQEPAAPSLLTPREIEVARLLVDGKTNPEIAAELFISERTVQSHVANIMAKLGVSSRTAVAARVVREHLVPERKP